MTIENLKQDERIAALENFKENLFNTLYPVGSVYITFSKDFDPNDVFTGRWTRNGTKGYTLVGAIDPDEYRDPNNNILEIAGGGTKGEVEHTLTVKEMPSHSHGITTWKNTDNTTWGSGASSTVDGAFANVFSTGDGSSQTTGDNSHWYGINVEGLSQPHNNVQPSIGVYIWHRTS